MTTVGSVLFIYTETSLHAGSGTALGAVDLPIQRERMSGLPMVQGSGIKGALREQLREQLKGQDAKDSEHEHLWLTLFGHEPPKPSKADSSLPKPTAPAVEQEMFAGAASLTDARLLLLPVRTVVGGWAWATCPMVLQRFLRDLDTVKRAPPWEQAPAWMESPPRDGQALTGMKSTVVTEGSLLIEDLDFSAAPDSGVDTLALWLGENAFPGGRAYTAFCNRLPGQLVVLGDTDFRFLTEHATEVVTRIRIGDSGTVAKGALWSEEALPAETVLYSLALISDGRRPKQANAKGNGADARQTEQNPRRDYKAAELRDALGNAVQSASRIHLGGDRTTGRGLVALRNIHGGT